MQKDLFIQTINAMKAQAEYDNAFCEHMGKAFPDAFTANLLPNNRELTTALLRILKSQMNDTGDMIEYFMYEKEYGTNPDYNAFEKDGSVIPLNDAGELWEYLEREKKGEQKERDKAQQKYIMGFLLKDPPTSGINVINYGKYLDRKKEDHIEEVLGEKLHFCGYCGGQLTHVRPGKYQCDNPDCNITGFCAKTSPTPPCFFCDVPMTDMGQNRYQCDNPKCSFHYTATI